MKLYLASRFSNKELVIKLAQELEKIGIITTQTWPTFAEEGRSKGYLATKDLSEIEASDGVLVLTERCELVPGGIHFEAGYAYGRNKLVLQLGPQVNIFYHLYDVKHFETKEELFKYLVVNN